MSYLIIILVAIAFGIVNTSSDRDNKKELDEAKKNSYEVIFTR